MSKYFTMAFVIFAFVGLRSPAFAAGETPASPAAAPAMNAPANSMKAMTKETKKPKHEMSAKQKSDVTSVKECKAQWKAAETAGATKGQKWREFLKECRSKKKTA
jgi:hypothetical protein